MHRPSTVGSFPRRHDGASDLSRQTGATPCQQVDAEVFLGEIFPVGTTRHSGHQPAPSVGENLTGAAVAVRGVPHGLHHRHIGAGLTLFHQLQHPQIVGSVPRQHVHRGDQLAVDVHHRGLVSVKTPALALVAVAHLRIVHRHHPVLAHTLFQAHRAGTIVVARTVAVAVRAALHVLEQSAEGGSQQLRRIDYRLPLTAVGGQSILGPPSQFQQPVGVGNNLSQQLPPLPSVRPVNGRFVIFQGL